MKSKKINIIPAYTDDYYRVETMIQNPLFKKKMSDFFAEREKMGYPIPKKGFKTWDQYIDWGKDFWKRYSELEKTVPEDELPTDLWEFQQEILTDAELDWKNKKYVDFLDSYMFFGVRHLCEELFVIKWIRNTETDKMELFLQLHPHTRREHILKFWDEISKEQKYLPGYTGKNKERTAFDRKLNIHRTHEEVRKKVLKESAINSEVRRKKPLDRETFIEMENKPRNLTLSKIRKANSQINKLKKKPSV